MTARALAMALAVAVGAGAGATGCGDSPERVGDRFVDLYFVEIDQARARAYTTGLASRKLDDELRLVESVRREYEPAEARPSITYERHEVRVSGERARATYEVNIRQGRQGTDESKRTVLLSLERASGRWRVANFIINEGEAPRPPAPSSPQQPH